MERAQVPDEYCACHAEYLVFSWYILPKLDVGRKTCFMVMDLKDRPRKNLEVTS